MTQVINKKLMKCCDNCHKYMNGACAWLSLSNEYCDEIMETQKVIDQLTNNWRLLEEWLKEYINKNDNWYNNQLTTHDKQYYGDTYYNTNYMLEKFLNKMKEIKEGHNE